MIRGAGGGKSSGGETHTPVEAPDTLRSIANARIVDLLSEGEIGGLTMKDIYLDYTPLQNEDGTFNFKNVSVQFRTGTQDQEPLEDFSDVESENAVGVELTDETPWTQALANLALTGLRIRLAVASLLQVDQETGDTNGYRVEYAIDLATDGGPFLEIFSGAFDGKASSVYERSHTFALPEATVSGWIVRVRRITPNSDSEFIQDDTSVVSYTELIRANIRYVNSALVGLVIDASQFRTVPTRAYRPYGRIIRVPSNYNPETRVYTGIWDGTFQLAVSNNPAWVYYDMATHFRYGLGRFLADSIVDKWFLYRIGQYCDELVDDGLGGEEPRFTCDIYLQKAADAYKVMQDLASVFRGICYWAAGMVVAVCDMPSDPVYNYTNANVQDGRFTYQGSSRQARHTVALVQWSDPLDFGRGKIEYVPDEIGIARYGIQRLDMTAIGATSQGQAHRAGLWALLSERLETNTVTFTVGLDGAIPQPGQVIRISDRLHSGAENGGRVRTATTTVITPDAMPVCNIGDTFTVILPSGLAQTRPISAVGADTVTVDPAYDAAPVGDSAWIVESAELPAELFRVIGVSENSDVPDITYTIMAIQHDPSKYDESDFGIMVQAQNRSQVPSNTISPPSSVTVESSTVLVNNVSQLVVSAIWTSVSNATSYEVSFRRNNGEWTPPARVTGLRYDLENVASGTWQARVKSIAVTGMASLEKTSDTLVVAAAPVYEVITDEDDGSVLIDFDTGAPLYSE